MTLLTPHYILSANIDIVEIKYEWDEWRVKDYFMDVYEDQLLRLDRLSDAANLALAIGCGEWVCHRYSKLDKDTDPIKYIEAAWAAIIYPGYCKYIETNDDEWRGPVRGPLNMTISIINDAIHCRDTDPQEAVRACWMYNLTQHVLPRKIEFENWFEFCVKRLEKHHLRTDNEEDIWEEGPPFGVPVPREALTPSFSYDPKDAPNLLSAYLNKLNPLSNHFLPKSENELEVPGFRGTLYKYSESDWEI